MKDDEIIKWLQKGDISIQYQVYRDLLNSDQLSLRQRIETEGCGTEFLSRRLENGHWGMDSISQNGRQPIIHCWI